MKPKMEITLFFILKIVLVVVGIIIVLSFFQFIISIRPPRYYSDNNPLDYGLEYEKVSFLTKDKINISGWLIKSEKVNGTVIIGHGYPFDKGNILPVAKFLYPNYNLLFYDHRYFGESGGRISTAGLKEVEDVKAAIGFIQKRFGKNKSIALYGFSLSASAMMMAKPEVNAIIADSAYADLDNLVKHIYRIFGPLKYPFVWTTNLLSKIFFGKFPSEISPANAIRDYDVPILVIHGEKDSQIPVENAHELKESNPNIDLWVIKNADHGQAYALHRREYEKKIKDFLKKNM